MDRPSRAVTTSLLTALMSVPDMKTTHPHPAVFSALAVSLWFVLANGCATKAADSGAAGSAGSATNPPSCPATVAEAGSECPPMGTECNYVITYAECPVTPTPESAHLGCDEWGDGGITYFTKGPSGALVGSCPCEKPSSGTDCNTTWGRPGPCVYPGDAPCQTMVCTTGGVWDTSLLCTTHVACPSTPPTAGAPCQGEGVCDLGDTEHWGCQNGTWIHRDHCPESLPIAGQACGGAIRCQYALTPASCDYPEYPSTVGWARCSPLTNEWVDTSAFDSYVYDPYPRCPCRRPMVGAQCTHQDEKPCIYDMSNSCEAVVCTTPTASKEIGAWDLPATCSNHVSCPSAEPEQGTACEGQGGCWFGSPAIFWLCDSSIWTKTSIQATE